MNSYLSILIADDDSDDAELLEEAISGFVPSYDIFNADNGVRCLSYLKNNPAPDLIFLDLNMPLKNGFDCLKWIRDNPSLNDTPVIIVSTSAFYKDVETCYHLGANFYMVKPTGCSSFINFLHQLFTALEKSKHERAPIEKFVLMEAKEPHGKTRKNEE